MRIKVFELIGYSGYCHYCDTNTDYTYVLAKDSETEWQEVSNDDYEALATWANEHNSRAYERKVLIVREPAKEEVKATVEQYIERAKAARKQREKQLRAAREAEKRRELSAAKRKEKLKEQREARERKLYEKLKEKFSTYTDSEAG